MKQTTQTTFGFKQQRTAQGQTIYRLATPTDVYKFPSDEDRERFIAAEGIVIVDHFAEFARLEALAPVFSEESLTRPPRGFDEPDVRIARELARQQFALWEMADPENRTWFRDYCQTNSTRLKSLQKIVVGQNHFEDRYRAGGGLMPVDWLGELRHVAGKSRFSEPEDLLATLEAGFFFDER